MRDRMEAAATVNAHVAMTSRVEEERRDSSLWKSSNDAGEDPRPIAPSLSLHIRSNAVGRKARGQTPTRSSYCLPRRRQPRHSLVPRSGAATGDMVDKA